MNILFDLDGTLWDSRSTLIYTWNKILKQNNLLKKPFEENDMNPFMGLLLPEILLTIFPKISNIKMDKVIADISEHESKDLLEKGGKLFPGVEKTLKELSENHTLYIVSNCQKGYIESFLEYFQFHSFFKDFECYGNTRKPKSENIKMVIERNNLEIINSIYVGDTQTDLEASKANHLNFLYCQYGFGEINLENTQIVTINQFDELKKYVENNNG